VDRITTHVKSEKPKWKDPGLQFPLSDEKKSSNGFLNIVAMASSGSEDDLLGTLQIHIKKLEELNGKTVTRQLWSADETEQLECQITFLVTFSKNEVKVDLSKDNASSGTLNYIRGLVSKKKCRYTQDGFDLDLAYVGDRLIAMGFPSEGIEASFRNPMNEVQKFLDFKHRGHYAVYNLCSERAYDPSKFPIVKRFPFDDHNPCPFDVLVDFCKDVKEYLDRDEKNVVAVHCKAGKGRTGLTLSAYLLYCGQCHTAEDALSFFASKRTMDGKGVTIQSQRRYVKYFEEYVRLRRQGRAPHDKTLMLYGINLTGVNKSSEDIWFTIKMGGKTFKSEGTLCERKGHKSDSLKWIEYSLHRSPIMLHKDVKIIFYKHRNEKMFHFWFNARFVQGPTLKIFKKNIDKASRDKKNKKYPAELAVELVFVSKQEPRESKRFNLNSPTSRRAQRSAEMFH